ncbi:TniQ family protein [Streptomyces sp. C]|uniref:TniQ family protein n=1 Tax=Streptomyces sp. C TaxID=253839 RepID=UPI0001B4CE3F|nr:TniQ family protein [Streptomyces sp. C]
MPRPLPDLIHRALRQIRPLAFETNASFIERLAGAHHLTTSELLTGLRIHPPKVHPVRERDYGPHARSELYLNTGARARIAQYTGIPEERLTRALPCWTEHRDRGPAGQARAGGAIRPSTLPAVIGCPHCTIARTGYPQAVPRYLPHHRLVCARHRTWALGPHTLDGRPVPHTHALLHQTPEIVRAHLTHLRLTRRRGPDADDAIAQAARITEYWRRHAPRSERVWPLRARCLAGAGGDGPLWEALAREAITYPETIALAGLLIRKPSTRYHRTQPGQSHPLHAAIARLLNRRWLRNPAHYPADLAHYIHSAPRHPADGTVYRHHVKPSPHADSNELTGLGYRTRTPGRATPAAGPGR